MTQCVTKEDCCARSGDLWKNLLLLWHFGPQFFEPLSNLYIMPLTLVEHLKLLRLLSLANAGNLCTFNSVNLDPLWCYLYGHPPMMG